MTEAKTAQFGKYQIKPFGDRLLVKRRVVGQKLGSGILYASDATGSKATDLADIISVPDFTCADVALLAAKERIIGRLTSKAAEGDAEALKALLNFNTYLSIKDLKAGDCVMISKYVGVTFNTSDNSQEDLTIVLGEDVISKIEAA
jgi:co-chaperonin GroES (HSP10)